MATSVCFTVNLVQPKASLAISSISSNKTAPAAGTTFVVSVVIQNGGNATGTARVTFKNGGESGNIVGTSQNVVISAGSSATVKSDELTADESEADATVCAVVECISGC